MTIIRSNEPIARKEHHCMFCGGVIQRGEQYDRYTIVDGDIYDFVSHIHCMNLTWMLDIDEYNEGISDYDFKCAIQDYVREHHPDWDYKNIAYCAKMIYDEIDGPAKLKSYQTVLRDVANSMNKHIEEYKKALEKLNSNE